MGASSTDELLKSNSSQKERYSKHVHDNVHGNIYLDPVLLRDLKQLGLSHLVYPGAVHSRFEHSLGVYWLAGTAVQTLKDYQGLELDIDDIDIQTVKLAGLLHDVGHGPFSHMFEREFLPRVLSGSNCDHMQFSVPKTLLGTLVEIILDAMTHEDMSLKMIDYIVDQHYIDIDSGRLNRVKSAKEKQFLYDIVANGRNGIDVDKKTSFNTSFVHRLMETMRVMGDEICYRAKDYLTVYKLFSARADLHRTVYTHAKVKAIELMLVDALLEANEHLGISSSIQQPAEFWKLDDTIINAILADPRPELKKARDIILRVRRRQLYQFCNEYSVPKAKQEHFKGITAQDIVCSQKAGEVTLKEEDVIVSIVKIDLTRGKKNPLESTNFYQDYCSDVKFLIDKEERISHLLPTFCQDMIVRVYAKEPHLVEAVSDAFENFQMKTYGEKTQVHSTPEKKKRRR
ncbi:HD domain-containing protein [Citrus sinensis]|uniref:HD domain-containing protein n=1 Tax=Citrus sinensis TaxID=2711 RepID=A0ACB8LJ00_CITSI|nr:HD domain-containing protein [Citrus sinensis]